jgi:hypothetical protein
MGDRETRVPTLHAPPISTGIAFPPADSASVLIDLNSAGRPIEPRRQSGLAHDRPPPSGPVAMLV